jgi:hypothetical protein
LVVFAAGACRTALTAARTNLARRLTLTVSRHHVEPTTPSWRRLLTSRRLLPPVRRQSSLPASTAAALNRTTPPHVCRRAPQADSHDIVTTSSSRQRRHGAIMEQAACAPQMVRRNRMLARTFGSDGVTTSRSWSTRTFQCWSRTATASAHMTRIARLKAAARPAGGRSVTSRCTEGGPWESM